MDKRYKKSKLYTQICVNFVFDMNQDEISRSILVACVHMERTNIDTHYSSGISLRLILIYILLINLMV